MHLVYLVVGVLAIAFFALAAVALLGAGFLHWWRWSSAFGPERRLRRRALQARQALGDARAKRRSSRYLTGRS